jgi:formate-dependent phosphoribosylglycinamide formyltransferase (GAR transformylase)
VEQLQAPIRIEVTQNGTVLQEHEISAETFAFLEKTNMLAIGFMAFCQPLGSAAGFHYFMHVDSEQVNEAFNAIKRSRNRTTLPGSEIVIEKHIELQIPPTIATYQVWAVAKKTRFSLMYPLYVPTGTTFERKIYSAVIDPFQQ